MACPPRVLVPQPRDDGGKRRGVGGCCSCGGPASRAGLVGFVDIDFRMAADPLGRLRACWPLPIKTARVRALCVQNSGPNDAMGRPCRAGTRVFRGCCIALKPRAGLTGP